jgi:DNA-directed RNA polymerase subunit RPC12/RpoP
MSYVCENCGAVFENPEYVTMQVLEYQGRPVEEKWWVSPCCSANYANTLICSICGGEITDKYISTEDNQTICPDCYIERNIFE